MTSLTLRMMWSCTIAALLLSGIPARVADGEELSLADLIEQVEPSCVRIDVTGTDGKSIGSGFVAQDAGWIVTNFHVVAGAKTARVRFEDGTIVDVDGFLAYDKLRDLAILKISTDRKLKALRLAEADSRKGEKTVAIGAPLGLSFTATEGIISAIREGDELKGFGSNAVGKWLQTSTPISPGSSGGPLLNLKGEVIGVTTSSLATAQNLNFAVSATEIRILLKAAAENSVQTLAKLGPAPASPKAIGASAEIVCKLPAKRKFGHRYKISEEEDEFDGLIWLRTEWMSLQYNDRRLAACQLRLSAARSGENPPYGLFWELGTASPTFSFIGPGSRRFQLLIDGESVELSDPAHKGKVLRGAVTEEMLTTLRLDGFLEIAAADEVKARLGKLEFQLTKQHLECLRDLASRLPEGVTLNGEIKVERYAPTADPRHPSFGKATQTSTAENNPSSEKPDDESEMRAAGKLRLALKFLDLGRTDTAKRYLQEIIRDYPETKAAAEAKKRLEEKQ